jgi:hypothetical protein
MNNDRRGSGNRAKYGGVLTFRHGNHDWISLTLGCIIIGDSRTQPPGLNSDNRIGLRIKRNSATKDIDTNRVFVGRMAFLSLLDQVAEEAA